MKLRDLNAKLWRVRLEKDGELFDALVFDCPLPDCEVQHLVPYSDAGVDVGKQRVWKRVRGSTLDDLTLSPSYLVRQPCGLHGFVRNGCWEGC